MKNLNNYLTTTAMLLITLNPFSSYAYSTKYSQRPIPVLEEEKIFRYSEFLNQMIIDIPIPCLNIPARIYHPKKAPFLLLQEKEI